MLSLWGLVADFLPFGWFCFCILLSLSFKIQLSNGAVKILILDKIFLFEIFIFFNMMKKKTFFIKILSK